MDLDKIFSKLHPLLHGFSINPRNLTAAWSYELNVGEYTLFITLDASGRVLLASALESARKDATQNIAWVILNENTFDQPMPALIHSATDGGEKIILWCEFALPTVGTDSMAKLPERFLARMLKTQSLLEGTEVPKKQEMQIVVPADIEVTGEDRRASKSSRSQTMMAMQLRGKLGRSS